MMATKPDSPHVGFPKQELVEFLAKHGFRTHPKGIIQHFDRDWTIESDGVAYLDMPANAVRQGDIVPERPIRVRAILVPTGGGFSRWKLESAEELRPGVQSNAMDRDRELPKNSPSWPDA